MAINEGISNLGYGASQLAGTTPAGLEKQNLDYAMSQLGMMTGGYGRGYTQPSDFGSAASPQAGITYGGTGDSNEGLSYGDSGFTPTAEDYESYLTGGRSMLQGLLNFVPFGGLFGAAADYNMGFNALSPNSSENLGYTNPFTDEYSAFYNKNYAGPGSDMAFTQDLMNPTEQRDMLINQQSFDILPEQTEESFTDWLGGMFGGNTLNYDPDMDLARSDFEDARSLTPAENLAMAQDRLSNPWSDNKTYNESLEGYLEAEQIRRDIAEMQEEDKTIAPVVSVAPEVDISDTSSPTVDTPDSTGLSDIGVGETGTVTDSSGLSSEVTNMGDGQYSIDMGENEEAIGYESPPSDDSSSSDDSGGGGCFITTATLQEVDTKDDGKELTTFRNFRDNYLKNKSYGAALVRDYYNTAPGVVAEINSRDNHKDLYKGIWKEHLRPINRLIEKGEEAEATSKYMLMMEELKEKFLPVKGERL